MFFQKNNPYRDRSTGRFTFGPGGGARYAASAATPYGGAYRPARASILNEDGSLNTDMAVGLLADPDISAAIDDAERIGVAVQRGGPSMEDGQLVALRKYQNFDGLPHIVEERDFDSLAGETLFRGDSKAEFAEQLRSGRYFGGTGVSGNGTYSTTELAEAASYSQGGLGWRGKDGGITVFKMHPDARGISGGDPPSDVVRSKQAVRESIQRAARSGALNSTQERRLDILFADTGRAMAGLGYDYFTGHYEGHYIVLNRTAMVISDGIAKAPSP